jgi:hypothetical protein
MGAPPPFHNRSFYTSMGAGGFVSTNRIFTLAIATLVLKCYWGASAGAPSRVVVSLA